MFWIDASVYILSWNSLDAVLEDRLFWHHWPLFLGPSSHGGCSWALHPVWITLPKRLAWVPFRELSLPCCVWFWWKGNWKWLTHVLETSVADSPSPGAAAGGRAPLGLWVWSTHGKAHGSSQRPLQQWLLPNPSREGLCPASANHPPLPPLLSPCFHLLLQGPTPGKSVSLGWPGLALLISHQEP